MGRLKMGRNMEGRVERGVELLPSRGKVTAAAGVMAERRGPVAMMMLVAMREWEGGGIGGGGAAERERGVRAGGGREGGGEGMEIAVRVVGGREAEVGVEVKVEAVIEEMTGAAMAIEALEVIEMEGGAVVGEKEKVAEMGGGAVGKEERGSMTMIGEGTMIGE